MKICHRNILKFLVFPGDEIKNRRRKTTVKKKGSIIIILDLEGMTMKNFLYMLSKYQGIENYELILSYQKNEKGYFKSIIGECLENQDILFYEAEDISNRGQIYNFASELAHTDILIFLDTNIALREHCLDELVYSLIEEDVLAVQPMIIRFGSPFVQSTGYVFSERCTGHALKNRNMDETIVNQSFERSALVSSVLAINRFVFEELRGFNETLPCEYMGKEITLRITKRGYKNFYNHRARAYYMAKDGGVSEYERGVDLKYKSEEESIDKEFHEIEELFQKQINKNQLSKNYVVINFSGLVQAIEVMRKINVKVSKIINCFGNSQYCAIEFEKVLPFYLAEEKCEYIYFTDNFCQVKNNYVWFKRREKYEDLIVDLSGNVIRASEICRRF